MSVRLLGQDDIHGMGLIKGLHHLDAIAQRAREEHDVVDGVSESAAFLDSNGGIGRQHLVRDQLRRNAPVAAEVSGCCTCSSAIPR